jgi:hypothetical protein
MNEQEPITKVGAKLSARLNLGDYNWVEFTEWVEDRVRDIDQGKTSKAMDRLTALLDAKLDAWARDYKDD